MLTSDSDDDVNFIPFYLRDGFGTLSVCIYEGSFCYICCSVACSDRDFQC